MWRDYVKKFKTTPINEFGDDEKKISEHVQVRNALFNFGEKIAEEKLSKLAGLRKKADYNPFVDLTSREVSDALDYMEKIFNQLKF